MAGILEPRAAHLTDDSRLIERQLDVTRRQVRLVEIGAAVVAWSVGLVMFVLAVVVIDHWLMPLGVVGRTLALVVFLCGNAAYIVQVLLPLCRRRINPVYAARAIEECAPSLKNSIINFLLLRDDHAGVKEAVLEAVERRAAADISGVPIDLAVDRTKLIRLGYVLLGVLSVFALYKIRSPKDPFQTVARVMAPWADINRPSRVSIQQVSPGDARVYFGRRLAVVCNVTGLREKEAVRLIYSTADGQVVNREVVMHGAPGNMRFEGELPPTDARDTGLTGVQQDFVYRLAAGDATTREYRITVVPAPTIVVEKLQYDFKPYTRRPQQLVTGQGDIQALEGTRVTVFAKANQAIKSAVLELDPSSDGKAAAGETVPLNVEEDHASGSFLLQLKPDRHTPWRTAYQLRFTNHDDERNDEPILHRIDVSPDLGPEIQWLTPDRPKVDVPEDGMQLLEMRAVDPDFGLQSIKLIGELGDKQPLQKQLLNPSPQLIPQVTVRYKFRPAELKLEAGDEIVVWGVASDNRVSPVKDNPDPNTARTSNIVLRITAPSKPPAASKSPAGQKPDDATDQSPAGKTDRGDNKADQPDEKRQPPGGEKGSDDSKQKPQEGDRQDGEEQQNGGKEGGDKSGEDEKGGKEGGEKGNQGGKSGGGGDSQQSGKNDGSQGGSKSQNNSKGSQGDSEGGEAEGQGSKGQGGKSASGGNSAGQDPGQTGNQSKSGGQGSKNGGKGNEQGDAEQQPGAERDPNGSDKEGAAGQGSDGAGGKGAKPHDGEVIEKVLEQLQKNGKNGSQGKKAGERPAGDQGAGENGKNEEGAAQPGDKSAKPKGDKSQGAGEKPTQGADGEKNSAGSSPKTGEPANKPSDNPQGNTSDDTSTEGARPTTAKPQDGGKQNGKPEDGQGKSGAEGQQPTGSKAGDPRSGDKPKSGERPGQGDPAGGKSQKPPVDDKKMGEGAQQSPAPGEGGTPQKEQMKTDKGPQKNDSGADNGDKKEPGAGDSGASGAGANSKDKTGNGPPPQPGNDRPKNQSPDSQKPESGETSAPGEGKKQSDSKGGESGDKKGGGRKGPGQSAQQEGNDSPGSKSAADQGAGKASDQGKGETGEKGGDQERAGGKTGKSSKNEAGKGSESGQAKQPGSKEGQSQGDGEGADSKQTPNASSAGKSAGGKQQGPTEGGGEPGSGEPGSGATNPEAVPDGEQANLDYARKATDLVIDHLRDQEHNPDPELLKQLGWSKDDLQQFLRRWDALKKSAETKPDAKHELDESLKSLGLRATKERKRAGGAAGDTQRDLQDSGTRSSPPSRYRDQFDAFRKGVGRPANK